MSDQGEITSDEAFERAGVPALLVAVLVTTLVVWLCWGMALWLLILVWALVFGFTFGLALRVFAAPYGFVRDVLSNLSGGGL